MQSSANSAALAVLLAASLALAGCGQKGPLTLPDRQAPTSATPPAATPVTPVTPAEPVAPTGDAPATADDRDNAKR